MPTPARSLVRRPALLMLAMLLGASLCALPDNAGAVAVKLAVPVPAVTADLRSFTLAAVRIGRAVFWIPSTIVVNQNDEVRLTLKNLVPGRHSVQGFEIPGYNIRVVLKGDSPKTVEFNAVRAGIFDYRCQLHPGDIGGQLIVRSRRASKSKPAPSPAPRSSH